VLDTRELGRRPGSQREVSRTVPAPADLGIEVLRVPEGEPVELDLRITDELSAPFQELFVYDDHGIPGEDDEVSELEGDLLDLEPLLRDAVVLALPFQPLCEDDCPGLCIECGARLAENPDHTHEAPIDPRWAKLTKLENDPAQPES
jgi:uncharacterized protein